jgi:O-acetyl-ADP-ribose deacetylase (regulator of RNase III)
MIKEVSGDILLSSASVIAHSVAPMDHFDSGLALSLRENYPSMVKDFRHYCHTHHPKPGEIFLWGGSDGKQIISLMAQEPSESAHAHGHPGKANVKYLDQCLKNLERLAIKEKFTSIALPKLATGVGGMDWEDVKPLIDKHLSNLDIPVFVYTKYIKGQAAE